MKRFGIVGVILLAVIILVGFVVINGGNKDKVKSETVTIKNAETEEFADDCANCPENIDGECTGQDQSEVYIKDCDSHVPTHEKGSKECEELQATGKCPGKCPHLQAKQSQGVDKM